MDRSEIKAANEALLAKRKALGIGRPQHLTAPIQAIVVNNGMTAVDFFQALQAGELPVSDQAAGPETKRVKWDSFNSDRHPILQKAVKTIARWYNERISDGGAIILSGNCGSGKTHLAGAIAELYGYGAMYLNEVDMVASIQAGYGGPGGRSLESITSYCRRSKLLIYDDLGAYETDNLKWMQNIYMSLFNGRQEAGLATMVTTNLPLLQKIIEAGKNTVYSPLENRLGARVYSRLIGAVGSMEYCVNLFGVPDYRQRGW